MPAKISPAKQSKRYNLEREALKSLASQAALRADVGSALASATDLRHILQKCIEAIVKHVEAAFARVWLLNDDEGVLELQASAGMYSRINGTYRRIPLGKLKIGYIAQKKVKYLNNDIVHNSRINDKKWAKLSYVLHSPMLDKFGLEDAIRKYLEGFGKRSGIRVRVLVPDNLGRFNREAELVLFRVVQESLTNGQRHSRSKWAEIRIERHQKKIALEVRDNGPSITTKRSDRSHPAGVGIASLQERTRQIGGRLDIEFSDVGTTARVVIPT